MRIASRRCGSEKRLPSGRGRHQDQEMPGIIPSVEAALYKMNVNGAADVPHNGRRCQHYLRLRRLNSEQREDRDEGLILIIAAALDGFPTTWPRRRRLQCVLAGEAIWPIPRSGMRGRNRPAAVMGEAAARGSLSCRRRDHRSCQRCLLARGGSQGQVEQGLN